MELAIVNLSGDLAHPELVGLLHAYDPELEVEIEVIDLDDAWFEQPDDVIAATADVPLRHGLLRQALRFLVRRRRDER